MLKYHTIRELLISYRSYNELIQFDFASMIDVDMRTVQRWEKNHTLIKPEKIKSIVLETLIPYQLLNNLNAEVAIPTYYDFKTRKYSLDKRNKHLSRALWLKDEIEIKTVNLNYKLLETPFFYEYDVYGDCNDTIFYLAVYYYRFFRDTENKNYICGAYTESEDVYSLYLELGRISYGKIQCYKRFRFESTSSFC